MKTLSASSLCRSMLGLILLAHPLMAQGPLAPPGPPAPMMKTLQQMEPRTLIENAGYVITVPGSYYLTANLNGGGTLNGIVVQASGVTIDLRGFAILNCQVGIAAAAGVQSVAVANGSVRTCTGAGVDLSLAAQCRLEAVILSNNSGDGASVGNGSLVTLCTASNNSGRGLVLGNGGTVFRCVAQANGNSGIVVSSSCQATENTCTSNGAGAGQAGVLTTGAGNRVEGNSANQNNGQGFQINGTGNLVIRNNACSNTIADYSITAGNNFGQILLSPGAAFANSNAWANFGCGGQPGSCQGATDCDDGNTCTTDTCTAGSCVHTPIPGCGNTSCATNADCDDSNACTTDTCQSGSCVHAAIAGCGNTSCAGAADCNDGNACTTDTCTGGSCVHTPIAGCGNTGCVADSDCNDGNACTSDACDVTTGACSHTAIAGCGSVCGNGIIEAGETCDDGNATNGDGCTSTCTVQPGFSCTGSPSVCTENGTFPLTVSKSGAGTGTVYSAPAGISCGATCAASYSSGTMVTLTASADPNSTFVGWSGACAGTGTCTVTMNNATSVMASFNSQGCTPSAEVCDGIDNNCNSIVDEGDPGGGGSCNTGLPGVCAAGTRHCLNGALVCVQNVNPSAEICDGLDNNCNGQVDEGVKLTFYRDADGDGYGATNITTQACSAPAGYVATPGDCNDNNAAIRPGAPEVCGDGIDSNCNGVDEGC